MKELTPLLAFVILSLGACPAEREDVSVHQLAIETELGTDDLEVTRVVGESGWAARPEADREAEGGIVAGEDQLPICDGNIENCVPRPIDADADGIRAELDCDDFDATVSPLAREILCNGVDENCNGVDDCDRDGDGLMDVDDPQPDDAAVGHFRAPDPPRWP